MDLSPQDTVSFTSSVTAVDELQTERDYNEQEKYVPGAESPKFCLMRYRDIGRQAKARLIRDKAGQNRPFALYLFGFDDTWSGATSKKQKSLNIRTYAMFIRSVERKIAWIIPSEDRVFLWHTPESIRKSTILGNITKIVEMFVQGDKVNLRMQEYATCLVSVVLEASPNFNSNPPHVIMPPGNYRTSKVCEDIVDMICAKADSDNLPILALHDGDDCYASRGFVKHSVITLGTKDKTWKEELPKIVVSLRKRKVDPTLNMKSSNPEKQVS